MSKQERVEKVFQRPGTSVLWLQFYDAEGKRIRRSSGKTDQAEAEKLLVAIQKKVAAQIRAGGDSGVLTFRRVAEERWLPLRAIKATHKEDAARLKHIYPFIGEMPIEKVEYEHIRDAILALWKRVGPGKDDISNRLVRHVYAATRLVFKMALKTKLVTSSPCILDKDELPPLEDKNPQWRVAARYTAPEVAMLIWDERIELRHRVLWALLAFTGSRINEITPRRWSDIQSREPMAQLTIHSGYRRKAKKETTTKTGVTRLVPVHPTLAAILAEWKLRGWREEHGRNPEPGDLIVPSPTTGGILNSNTTLETLQRHLRLLGLRERGQHDFRRTLTTLLENAEPEPAVYETFRLFTHAKPKDIKRGYGELQWKTMCREMAKLHIPALAVSSRVVQLPVVAVAGGTVVAQQSQGGVMLNEINGRGGTRSLPQTSLGAVPSVVTLQNPSMVCARDVTKRHRATNACASRGTAENHAGFSLEAELVDLATELLQEHQRSPHDQASCPMCQRAADLLGKARGGA